MFITVAGNKKDVKEGITISELISEENIENAEYVTVSVNDEFIDSREFQRRILGENDIVEFLYFMGGGSFSWHLQMSN